MTACKRQRKTTRLVYVFSTLPCCDLDRIRQGPFDLLVGLCSLFFQLAKSEHSNGIVPCSVMKRRRKKKRNVVSTQSVMICVSRVAETADVECGGNGVDLRFTDFLNRDALHCCNYLSYMSD